MPAPARATKARPPMNNAKHDMIRETKKNNGPGGASNTVTLGLTPAKEGLMDTIPTRDRRPLTIGDDIRENHNGDTAAWLATLLGFPEWYVEAKLNQPPLSHNYEVAPYMSAGRWHLSERYIVGWPDHGVVKVGTTSIGRRRYGLFLARGGTMIHNQAFPPGMHSFSSESRIERILAAAGPRAFADKTEAAPLLGNRGAGYLECYRIDTKFWPFIADLAERY